ncbi:MAG: hypothetical protein ACP5QO_06680 [Clostridia bacterium]
MTLEVPKHPPEPVEWQVAWEHLDAVEAYFRNRVETPVAERGFEGVQTARRALMELLLHMISIP